MQVVGESTKEKGEWQADIRSGASQLAPNAESRGCGK